MQKLIIKGKKKLTGTISISGSKNIITLSFYSFANKSIKSNLNFYEI